MKILIAIDDSKGSFKAVDYVGQHFACVSDLRITLFHILPNMPATFWDDGHFLTKEESEARREMIEKWLKNQKSKIEPVFKKAIEHLTKKGISPERIETKSVSEPLDVAESILTEARTAGYQMLVVGRHSYSRAERLLIGSVSNKIINYGAGITICVVE